MKYKKLKTLKKIVTLKKLLNSPGYSVKEIKNFEFFISWISSQNIYKKIEIKKSDI